MVDLPDIPTLNRSVNEFRSLIAENTKRARALEKTKRAREAKADAELQSKITQLTDKIEKAGEKAKDTDKATLELLQQEREDRISQTKRDEELKVLTRKTLGLSAKRLGEQQKANEEAKGARQRLEDLRAQLQSQGVDIKANKNFQKLELEVEKKERKARLKSKPLLSSLKEQGKDSLEKTAKVFNRFLGPKSFFGKQIGGLFGLLNRKIISPLTGGLVTALKGGIFVLSLLALIEFLNSDLWKNLKDKIIPFLKMAFEKTIELFTSLKQSIEDIFNTFSEEGFREGFKKATEEIFGPDNVIKKVLDTVILPVLAFIGRTFKLIADLIDPPLASPNDDSTVKGRLNIIMESIGTFTLALGILAAAILPSALLGTAFVLGRWVVIPTLIAAFATLDGSLISLAAQIRGIKTPKVPDDITTVKPSGPAVSSKTAGAKFSSLRQVGEKFNVGAGLSKVQSFVPGTKKFKMKNFLERGTSTPGGTQGGGALGSIARFTNRSEEFLKKFPKSSLKFLGNATGAVANFLGGGGPLGTIGKRVLPGLNLYFAGTDILDTLANKSLSTEEKVSQISGIVARTFGASIGFFLGSVFGFPASPIGSLISGLAGAGAGGIGAGFFAENLVRKHFGLDPLPVPRELVPILEGIKNFKADGFFKTFGFEGAADAGQFTPQGAEFGGGLFEGTTLRTGQRIGTQSPLANISSLNLGGGSLPSGSVNFGSVVPPPQPGGANFGPGVSVNSAPVNVDNSSVQNVTNVVRTLSRSGDGFTSIALQNYGLAVPF